MYRCPQVQQPESINCRTRVAYPDDDRCAEFATRQVSALSSFQKADIPLLRLLALTCLSSCGIADIYSHASFVAERMSAFGQVSQVKPP